MTSATETGEGDRNHPLALRMGAIAFITQNLGVAALYGAYGVLIIPIEAKLGVDRTISTLGVPIAGIGISRPAQRLQPDSIKRIGPLVNETALNVSRALGFTR